jgi:fibro-slime domain-containing protein
MALEEGTMTSWRTLGSVSLACGALAALGCVTSQGADGDGNGSGESEIDTGSGGDTGGGGDGNGGVSLELPDPTDGGEGGTDEDPCAGDDPPPECDPPECGDGEITGDFEVCDDGRKCVGGANAGTICTDAEECDSGICWPVGGDGCSATCDAVEADWQCPVPGEPCIYTIKCSDGKIGGPEQCDDGGTCADGSDAGTFCVTDEDCSDGGICQPAGGDGCDEFCQLEPGWTCPSPGRACIEVGCGDGVRVGREVCEPSLTDPPEACTDSCTIADGWACNADFECHLTVCGDGVAEGTEQCDDGDADLGLNYDLGDGCTPECRIEPVCRDADGNTAACASACGDGFKLPTDTAEECDDGNSVDGDGCSSTCQIELGFECVEVTTTLPEQLELPLIIRDFIRGDAELANGHADFNTGLGNDRGIVEATLGVDGKPVYAHDVDGTSTTNGPDWFDSWYRDDPLNMTIQQTMVLTELEPGSGEYQFASPLFFPIDEDGWVAEGTEELLTGDGGDHNFFFTSEVRYWFEYQGDEEFTFTGDDDVFVFVNGQLVADIGGVHGAQDIDFSLADLADDLGLSVGNVYEIVVFQAERRVTESEYTLTLAGFTSSSWECGPICGDGIVAGNEVCDDGELNGTYGHCTIYCDGLGPHCGDAIVQSEEGEECDNGINLSGYQQEEGDCAPGCVLPPYCGDGVVDTTWGEGCDDGVNDGGHGECQPDCQPGPRCGDGILQEEAGEECDDGNNQNGDLCNSLCMLEDVT